MVVRPWPLTSSPVSAWGLTTPSSVLKTTSTTASSGKGLRTSRTSWASLVVTPSAKYHDDEADEAHGVTLSPSGPLATTSATASPPSSSTTAAANGEVTTSARRTAARAAGPTVRGTALLSPLSGKTVTEPVSGRGPALATTTEASAAVPDAGAPGQYQADERAEAGAPRGTWALTVVAWDGAPVLARRSTIPPATSRATSTTRAGARRVRGARGPAAALPGGRAGRLAPRGTSGDLSRLRDRRSLIRRSRSGSAWAGWRPPAPRAGAGSARASTRPGPTGGRGRGPTGRRPAA